MLRLTVVRKERNISQLKLSTMTGISPSDISGIEKGIRRAFPGWRQRIAAALGVEDAESLFQQVEENTSAGTVVPTQNGAHQGQGG